MIETKMASKLQTSFDLYSAPGTIRSVTRTNRVSSGNS